MPAFFLIIIVFVTLNANSTQSCKTCHKNIYLEFQESMHKHSTLKKDPIFNAMWQKHPDSKNGKFSCAKCHAPKESENQITCLTCHKIKDIKEHPQANENIYETEDKLFYSAQKGKENQKVVYKKQSSWFGLINKTEGSPYHDIDYRNEIFYNGKVCMGCHSHKRNKHNFLLCKTSMQGVSKTKQNCISCHMPQVKGSATSIRLSKTHAYHGFAGLFNNPQFLSKYIDITLSKTKETLIITLSNNAPHKLLLHPLRVLELRVNIISNNKTIPLKKYRFEKVIGTNNKVSMPWEATQTLRDTRLDANEKRQFILPYKIKKGDKIEVILGYYLIKENSLKILSLDKLKKVKDFIILKHLYIKE